MRANEWVSLACILRPPGKVGRIIPLLKMRKLRL